MGTLGAAKDLFNSFWRVPREVVGARFNLVAGLGTWLAASSILTSRLKDSELLEYPPEYVLFPAGSAALLGYAIIKYYPIDKQVRAPVKTFMARSADATMDAVGSVAP